MMEMTKFDKEKIWNIVKETRESFLSSIDYPRCRCLDLPRCRIQETLLIDSYIEENIKRLEKRLKMKTTSNRTMNISEKTLQWQLKHLYI